MKKTKLSLLGLLGFLSLCLLTVAPAFAQTAVPDMTQFGYPKVTATVNFTPGTATTLTAGNQKVAIPADFYSKTAKFEFLEGVASTFPNLGEGQGQGIVTAFAFRVTDTTTNQLVGRFDKPVTYTVTDSSIVSTSQMYNTSAANPIVVTKNGTPSTISGTQLSQNFGGAGVGWLVLTPVAPRVPSSGLGGTAQSTNDLTIYLITGLAAVALSAGLVAFALRKRTI